jgi:hypothetical protein
MHIIWKVDESSWKIQGCCIHFAKKSGTECPSPKRCNIHGTLHPWEASSMGRFIHRTLHSGMHYPGIYHPGTHHPGSIVLTKQNDSRVINMASNVHCQYFTYFSKTITSLFVDFTNVKFFSDKMLLQIFDFVIFKAKVRLIWINFS